MRLTIYWTCTSQQRAELKRRLGIRNGTTIAGETTADIPDDRRDIIDKCLYYKLIKLRNKPDNPITPNV